MQRWVHASNLLRAAAYYWTKSLQKRDRLSICLLRARQPDRFLICILRPRFSKISYLPFAQSPSRQIFYLPLAPSPTRQIFYLSFAPLPSQDFLFVFCSLANPTDFLFVFCAFTFPRFSICLLRARYSYSKYYTTKQNEAKPPFRGRCPFHACRRFNGVLVPEAPLNHYGLGLSKPATFLRLWSPSHKRACSRIHEASLVLRATIL